MRDNLTSAINIASAAHNGMMHDGHPTYSHLEEVARTLIMFETVGDHRPYEDTVIGAWLHDILRYTSTTPIEISKMYGRRVAQLAVLATDPGAKGTPTTPEERAEGKRLAYEQFMLEPDPGVRSEAGLIRCVDRFVNMRSALEQGVSHKTTVYRAEFKDFMRVYGVTLLNPIKPHRQNLWNALFEIAMRPTVVPIGWEVILPPVAAET